MTLMERFYSVMNVKCLSCLVAIYLLLIVPPVCAGTKSDDTTSLNTSKIPLKVRVTVKKGAPGSYFQKIADLAIKDLNSHYWQGSYNTGYIDDPTGQTRNTNGYLWECGIYLFALENMYEATGNPQYRDQVQAHWNYLKSKWGDKLATCGMVNGVTPSPCQDDAAWSLMMFIKIYNATNDPYALQCAEELATMSYNRWHDPAGGGMWYSDFWNDPSNDTHYKLKSLYQSAMAMGFFKLWELTGNQTYKNYADDCYNWIQKNLLRTDGLYWNSVYHKGLPSGGMYAIHEGGSVTYLGGDIGMAVLNARYYRLTGDDSYRQNALKTVAAIRAHVTDVDGVLIDDMDLWTNGSWATEYALEVLTLPGISKLDIDCLHKTAASIYAFDRTSDGYYGACWNGPIGNSDGTGTQNRWTKAGNYIPNQIMTSASAIGMLVGAASCPLNTANTYDAMFLKTSNIPTVLIRGATVIPIKVLNTGTRKWDPNDKSRPVSVGIWLEDSSTGKVVGDKNSRALLLSTVSMGDELNVNFTVPDYWPTGDYNLKIDMVRGKQAWFSDKGCTPCTIAVKVY